MSLKSLCSIAGAIGAASAQDTPRPNIVIFQPDDMPFYDHWGPPGNAPSSPARQVISPGFVHMERIREEGVQFQNAWVTSPACGTSRYGTLRGVFASRSEHARNQGSADSERVEVTIPNTKLSEGDCASSVASGLRGVGYRTGIVGKWHLANTNPRSFPASYGEAQALVTACGFDFADGLYMENFERGWLAESGIFSHNMEWVADKAIEFVDQAVDAGEPFMLYFNPTTPHEPAVEEALSDFACTQTPGGDLDSEPMVGGMTSQGGCVAYRETVFSRASESLPVQRDQDLGCIWADDALGALLWKLEIRGVLDNTFIVVMMDHGIETKNGLFENGNRIAHFVRYPPLIAAGSLFEGHVTNIDLTRTILDVAGVDPDYDMDGVSWLEPVSSEAGAPAAFWTDRCLFFESEFDRAVICGCFKLLSIDAAHAEQSTTLQRAGRLGYSIEHVQLYDICADSGEADNLQAVEAHADTLATMHSMLECHERRTAPDVPSSFTACGPTLSSEASSSGDGAAGGGDGTNSGGDSTTLDASRASTTLSVSTTTSSSDGTAGGGGSTNGGGDRTISADTSRASMTSSVPTTTRFVYMAAMALGALSGV